MSTQAVSCPHCQAGLKVNADMRKFRCPKCQQVVDLDTLESFEEASSYGSPALPSSSLKKGAAATRSSSRGQASFPDISILGDEVKPELCIEQGTGMAVFLGICLMILGVIFIAAVTFGFGLILLLIAPIVDYFNRKKAMALIHGSGLRVGPDQFPEIYECVEGFSGRLGLTSPPDVYIVEASVMNAAAVKLGKRNVVLLTDDLIHGCLESGEPKALSFVLAHELGHIALNHNGMIRGPLRTTLKKLSRLDEYSCDRIGRKLVGDGQIAKQGIVLLTVGYHLLPYLNPKEMESQAFEVAADKQSKKAEKAQTHPLLFHRIHKIMTESGET